jgi:hypothetical protein
MDSKILILIGLLATACSKGPSSGVIGTVLKDSAGLYNTYGLDTTRVFIADNTTARLIGFDLNTLAITHAFELSQPTEKHSVAMDINEKFVIDFSTKHMDVISMDGSRSPLPFKFQGTPVSAAYNPYDRIMIMQDDLQSIGIMTFTESGAIEKSWLGGPQLATGKSIVAGDLDKSGRLILAMNDNSFTIVDIDQTLAQSAWQFQTFTPGFTEATWVAPDHGVDNMVLVASNTGIASINIATQAISDQITFPTNALTALSYSKSGKPHIIGQSSGNISLYYLGSDGKLVTKSLSRVTLQAIEQTYLTSDASILNMVIQSTNNDHRLIRMRLSDALVTLEKTINTTGDLSIGTRQVFVNYRSELGAVALHELDSDTTKRQEGFNFQYLSSHN